MDAGPAAKSIETYRAYAAKEKRISLGYDIVSKNLSYASSLLGGFLFDSFNRTKSACTYEFHKKGSQATYALLLNKKWILQDGANFFYFPGLARDGIFGAGETFHPRLREVKASSPYHKDEQNRLGNDAISTNCVNFRGGEQRFKVNETLTDDEKSDIRKMMHFAMESAKFLIGAKIMSLNGEVFKVPNETAEAQAMIASQRLALQKMGESWIGDDWTAPEDESIEAGAAAESGSAGAAAAATAAVN